LDPLPAGRKAGALATRMISSVMPAIMASCMANQNSTE
jgi:hypothetical protein